MYGKGSERFCIFVCRLVVPAWCVVALGLGGSVAEAEPAMIRGDLVPVALNSGALDNPQDRADVVFSQTIDLGPDVPWMRVIFSQADLPPGSAVRVTSLLDGESQTLDTQELARWSNGTAFFNGSAVKIELIAAARSSQNLIRIGKVYAGQAGELHGETVVEDDVGQVADICVRDDNRKPSEDKRVGRLLGGEKPRPGGGVGTAFIIDTPPDSLDKLHLTAGHCFGNYYQNLEEPFVLQFNVPPISGTDCTIHHPPVADQFAVNGNSVISVNRGPGNDYAVFQCYRQNGQSTYMHSNQQAFSLAEGLSLEADARITGYGVDGGNDAASHTSAWGNPHPTHPGDCGYAGRVCEGGSNHGNPCDNDAQCPDGFCFDHHCDPGTQDAVRNCVQQMGTGKAVAEAQGDKQVIQHNIHSCAGNSGSPIILEDDRVVGIHTHGSCQGSTKVDTGTPVWHVGLQQAIMHEKGKKPTVSEWGMIVVSLLLLTGIAVKFGRRRSSATKAA